MACIPIHFNTILKSKDQTNHDKLLIIIINYYKLINIIYLVLENF